jgi:hypothetical protein
VTLVEFLTAMLDRDEARARAGQCAAQLSLIQPDDGQPRPLDDEDRDYGELLYAECEKPRGHLDYHGTLGGYAWHAHDPAGYGTDRVLREVEAKRRIIDEHEHELSGDKPGCWTCDEDRDYELIPHGWCLTLRLLALPDADDEDYDEAWRP